MDWQKILADLAGAIDWPNALAGFVLGILAALPFLFAERRRAKAERRLDAATAWMSAAKEIELAAGQPDATAGSLYLTRVKHPADLWRSILGPDDFRAEERLEGAFAGVEHFERRFAQGQNQPGDEERLERARQERHDAFVTFANISRAMQSVSYDDVVTAEHRKQLRSDYRRHPFRSWSRERRNKKVRRADEKARAAH